MERQLHLWPETDTERSSSNLPHIAVAETRSVIQRSLYTPLKRLAIVHVADVLARPVLDSSRTAVQFFRDYWKQQPGNDQERFVIACLNVKNRVESVVAITIGTLDASLVHPREVFRPAVAQGASSIILSHNHPSGDPTPSREDHAVTKRLTECGQILGIDVLDHVIHGDGTGDAVSIRDLPNAS
ncbi:MAG: JAB domain-containing protein [Fuerstiella sp.]